MFCISTAFTVGVKTVCVVLKILFIIFNYFSKHLQKQIMEAISTSKISLASFLIPFRFQK